MIDGAMHARRCQARTDAVACNPQASLHGLSSSASSGARGEPRCLHAVGAQISMAYVRIGKMRVLMIITLIETGVRGLMSSGVHLRNATLPFRSVSAMCSVHDPLSCTCSPRYLVLETLFSGLPSQAHCCPSDALRASFGPRTMTTQRIRRTAVQAAEKSFQHKISGTARARKWVMDRTHCRD